MTPKTLRKERKEKFTAILMKYYVGINDGVLEELLDAAESRSERSISGIEAAMFADRPVTSNDLDPEAEALKAFETALHLPGNWQWYPGKGSDEKAWKELRAFVVKLYRLEGVKAFEEYYTWSIQPFSRGAMTVLGIKRNPGDFEASWAAFKASAMLAKRTDEARPEYQPYKPEEKNYVPRPANIKPIIRKPAE